MAEHLTRVELQFHKKRLNHWLRFGAPHVHQRLDRARALALFEPGRLFGYVRWRANEFGMQDWRFAIVQARKPARAISCLQGVHPGGEVLLFAAGAARVKRALLQIDVLEADGFDPEDVSPAYYRHVHNRIMTAQAIRAYSQDQHAAHLARKKALA